MLLNVLKKPFFRRIHWRSLVFIFSVLIKHIISIRFCILNRTPCILSQKLTFIRNQRYFSIILRYIGKLSLDIITKVLFKIPIGVSELYFSLPLFCNITILPLLNYISYIFFIHFFSSNFLFCSKSASSFFDWQIKSLFFYLADPLFAIHF